MDVSDGRKKAMEENAAIVGRRWLHLRWKDKVLIVTTNKDSLVARIMQKAFRSYSSSVEIMICPDSGKTTSVYFDEREDIFDPYDVVVGATAYSIVTTTAVKRMIQRGGRFLSFPCSTNDGRYVLEYSFLKMDTGKSKLMAEIFKKYLDDATLVRVATPGGSELTFSKKDRTPGFFNGDVRAGKGFSSSSIEVYVPIEETKTEGVMVVDGSLGYIGRVDEPFRIVIHEGKITEIQETKDGLRLRKYLESYNDPDMYVAGELGIGLNSLSCCTGNCYIEDESAYGTFHIGFGRNIALGGVHEASGHFDLIARKPDLYADNRKLISTGRIIVPQPQVY